MKVPDIEGHGVIISRATTAGLITSQLFIAHWQIIEMSNIACVNSAAQAPKD